MKKLLALFCVVMMSAAIFANPNPCLSVKSAQNTVCASFGYGCSSAWSDELTVYVSLENASRGTTVVKVQVTTDYDSFTKTIYISNGEYSGSATFIIGEGNCGKVKILSAYVK